MGLLSLFGKSPLSKEKIAKVAKLAANPFAQPDVRMREMQRLIDDGSDEALRGVLRRLATNAQGHIADEDEKKWLENALVKHQEAALPALRDYIFSESKLTYALHAYARIVGDEQATQFLLEVLEHYGPQDYRSLEAKLQLVLQISDLLAKKFEPDTLLRLIPFLSDHGDDIRWAVLDALKNAASTSTLPANVTHLASAQLGVLVTDSQVSARIARHAADFLVNLQWPLDEAGPKALAPVLEEEFFLDKKCFVRRRVKKVAQGS